MQSSILPVAFALSLLVPLLGGCAGPRALGPVPENEPLREGPIPLAEHASLRGISSPSAGVVWVSGSQGVVLRSRDAGLTFHRVDPVEDSLLDFRMLVAFDQDHAWAGSAGPGAESRLFETKDGGTSWSERLVNEDPSGFWDALGFWDPQHGLIVGDAVGGFLTILRTEDGGDSWVRVPEASLPASPTLTLDVGEGVRPEPLGEVCFAASNRSLALGAGGEAWIGTGGSAARVWHSTDWGRTWTATSAPLRHGDPAAGIFAIAMDPTGEGVAVGGKFDAPGDESGTAAFSEDGGRTWHAAKRPPTGYRSAVAPISAAEDSRTTWIAVGTGGASYSVDGGREWRNLNGLALNALAVDPDRRVAYCVGPKGRFCVIRLVEAD